MTQLAEGLDELKLQLRPDPPRAETLPERDD
jgi:hypothetical protein